LRRNSSLFSLQNKGFTLLELLLAIAIAAVIITIVNFAFFQSNKNIEAVRTQREAYQTVRIVMDRMVKDLTCAYLPSPVLRPAMTALEQSMYRFVGTDDDSSGIDKDTISFTTTTDIGFSKVPGGICEVDYYLKEMEDRKDVFTLMRREDPTPHYGITKAGSEMEIAEDVLGMNIIYIDDTNQEVKEWDLSKKLTLPKQVKVTLTMEAGKDKLTYTATASLPLSGIKLGFPQG
jgi:prepilin-type N-terminal cleavage/methylation domain-containing protein